MCAWCLPASPPCQQPALVRSILVLSTEPLLLRVNPAVSEQEGAEEPLSVRNVLPSRVRAVSCCCVQKCDVQHRLYIRRLCHVFCAVKVGPWVVAEMQDLRGASYWAGGVYRSAARVVLVGHGADEQCGGYGRHRSRFRTHARPGIKIPYLFSYLL